MTTDAKQEVAAAEREMLATIKAAMDTFTARTGMVVSYLSHGYYVTRTIKGESVEVTYSVDASYKTGDKCS